MKKDQIKRDLDMKSMFHLQKDIVNLKHHLSVLLQFKTRLALLTAESELRLRNFQLETMQQALLTSLF